MVAEPRPATGRAVEPPCPHFGICGGCAAQHLERDDYGRWKRGFLEAALRRHSLCAEVGEIVAVGPESRRRARFFAVKRRGAVALGFHARASHDVVDMQACPVLEPALYALTGPLRGYFLETLAPGARAEAEAQFVDGALDVAIRHAGPLDMRRREALARLADDAGLARISFAEAPPQRRPGRRRKAVTRGAAPPEVVVERTAPTARFGGVPVSLPPLAFLQATKAGETALTRAVHRELAPGAAVADLYCGAGTFTFALAEGRRIVAYDGDTALIAALNRAARAAGLAPRVEGHVRDLARRPLLEPELRGFDAAVVNPPRAGAARQVQALASSTVGLIVMVSCDPRTFARDARILIGSGFAMGPVTPVDQFVWSRHLEVVAAFSR